MIEEENIWAEKIANALVSFQQFLKKFKQVIKDENIQNQQENNKSRNIIYAFRKFNLECYIIDKIHFDNFCSAINYEDTSQLLSFINDEDKNKFKQTIKNLLIENKYNPDGKNIKLYSEEESLKKIINNFNNYTFLNKEILVDGMKVPEENLKNKKILLSKNENNTSLLNIQEYFIMTINIIKKSIIKEKENKEKKEQNEEKKEEIKNKEEIKPKTIKKGMDNIYYVEDITKKIFILFYKKDEFINKKIEKKIVDPYNFKNYYLINKDWLNEYKSYFLYDTIIRKLDKNFKDYSYKRIKTEINDIAKDKIRQIKLFNETIIPDDLKDITKLETKIKIIKINNKDMENDIELETKDVEDDIENSYNIPSEFEIINYDIYDLLIKEKFLEQFNEEIENKLCYQILLGNRQVIIKNKASKDIKEKDIFLNELLIFEKNKNDNNGTYILKYILNYEKKVNSYEELGIILNKGLDNYLINKKIKLGENNSSENILDENSNVLGKIININIDQNLIKTVNYMIDNNINEIIDNIEDKNKIILDKHENNININKKELDKINKNIEKYKIIKENQQDLDFNQNEINIINSDDNNIIKANDKNNKNKIEISFDDFKNKLKNINFDILSKNIINNIGDHTNLDIYPLNSDTIEPNLNCNKVLEVVLMDEIEYSNYKNLINKFEKYKKEKKSKKQPNKYEELTKYIKDNKIIIPDNIKLVNNYETCLNSLNNDKKFFILNKSNIIVENTDKIYYFFYDSNPYIYFKENRQILKVILKNKNHELVKLEIYKQQETKEDYLNHLRVISDKNNIKNYKMSKKDIYKYYLINDKWIDFIQNTNKKTKYQKNVNLIPKFNENALGYKYPIDFDIIIINEKNKSIIENMNKYIDVKKEDIENIIEYEIFFLNNKLNQTYICIIKGSKIYFYTLKKNTYNIYFVIDYTKEEIKNRELQGNLLKSSIELYLKFMVLNNTEPYKLFDIEFNNIGSLISLQKEKIEILEDNNYMKRLSKDDINIYSVLSCFANIKEFKEYIPLKKDLITIKDSLFFRFFQILRIFLKYEKENVQEDGVKIETEIEKKCEELYFNFLVELENISNKENNKINILGNIELIIKFLILRLQKDIYKFKFEGEYSYGEALFPDSTNNKRTFIQDLFFFELLQECECEKNETFEIKYYLKFDLKEKDNKIEVKTLFEKLNEDSKCECPKNKIKRKITSLPKYLLLIINSSEEKNKIVFNKDIDINKYCNISSGKVNYELHSFIDFKKEYFYRSYKDNKWYKCNELINFDYNIYKEQHIPNLLIYKKK